MKRALAIDWGTTRTQGGALLMERRDYAEKDRPSDYIIFGSKLYHPIWSPLRRKKFNDPGELVKDAKRLYREGVVSLIAADPYGLVTELEDLRQFGYKVIEVSSQTTRTYCDEHLQRLIREGRLKHPGTTELRKEFGKAVLTTGRHGTRITGPRGAWRGDSHAELPVCASMAAWVLKEEIRHSVPVIQQPNPFYGGERASDLWVKTEIIRTGILTSEGNAINHHPPDRYPNVNQSPIHNVALCRARTRGCLTCRERLNQVGFFAMSDDEQMRWLADERARGQNSNQEGNHEN